LIIERAGEGCLKIIEAVEVRGVVRTGRHGVTP